ncbi:MAG: nicotinate phosphoribosyltransferase [Thelocarpon superellum]|nr:MAG: nicotinate phosphoribosyltransferase [Thelocarpon superellum]
MVLQGLIRASRDGKVRGSRGKLTGTSNVHFAMQYKISPIGTVAHEWFMGIAAITNSYEEATEIALRHWVATFGEGILGIALTDTFGTPTFLRSFRLPITHLRSKGVGEQLPQHALAASSTASARHGLNSTGPPAQTSRDMVEDVASATKKTYAQVFTGVRQDSGDPNTFVQIMRDFYDREGITDKKTIVFSDSLNIKLCLEYKQKAEEAGFEPSFGVGTFLTNDFKHLSSGDKSVPLNIVIKLSSASGRPAVKISDNIGKNTGDKETVDLVKHKLGYVEKTWEAGDEKARWGSASGDELNKDPR